VWSYDLVSDQTEDGRTVKILTVLDEFTRRVLAMEPARSLTSGDVIAVLERLISQHGAPAYIRSDNGPEFVAAAIRAWLAQAGIRTLYIAPGSPGENAYIESLHSRLRDELLDRELFSSLLEAKYLLEEHRREHNERRPRSGLGQRTPEQFHRAWMVVHGIRAEAIEGASPAAHPIRGGAQAQPGPGSQDPIVSRIQREEADRINPGLS
jgi:transposase InsO family protein